MVRERFFLELDPPGTLPLEAPHVVIVGGGFAGLKAAHALAGSAVRVTLIDRRNFNLFQPLLYQVATGLVAESDVAAPLRHLVGRAPNVQVLMGEVEDLDPAAREVVFNDRRYRYDHLILATGATSSFFGHDDWRQQAIAMKTLADAEAIQRHVLSALEEAEQTPDAERRELLQSVVVIGGGPTGCELAASLIDLMRHTLAREFKQLDPAHCRVTLVDPGDRVLRAMDPELSAAAGERLQQIGVELLLGGRVKAIEERLVRLSVGEAEQTLAAGTICWTAGVAPSGLGRLLAERTGCPLDKGGRVVVEPDFSVPGHPEIRVVGDLCTYSHTADGKPLPGMAGPAVQMGTWVARDILERSQGREQRPFRFVDFGTMAVIGPWFAVADLRGLKVSGAFGFLLWAVAHLAFMPARENRLILLTKWLWMIVVRQRSALVISEPLGAGVPAAVPAPVTPGS